MKIRIDGIPVSLDDEEQIAKNQNLTSNDYDQGIQPIQQPTELGESLKELNNDTIEGSTRMSGIDLRSRLHYMEIPYILAMDVLVALGVCSAKMLSFTRSKKRLAVSIAGKGREDMVRVISGKQEQDRKTGFMGGMQKFFGFKGGGGEEL